MTKCPENPLSRLEQAELIWLFGILKDACRERLEKNLTNQMLEAHLVKRGAIPGRVDPRPQLRQWEPRYRKFLEVSTELYELLRSPEGKWLQERISK